MYRLTPQAEADLIDIGDYFAADNPKAAIGFIKEIEKACALLGGEPLLGRARPEITPDARSWGVGKYLILYRQRDYGVEIIRVVHGARRLGQLGL
jgi:toxin ParE1/3/4